MRLIDADLLLKKVNWFEYYDEDGHWDGFIYIAVDDVAKAPTVDAIIGVRCGDCEYWNSESIWCDYWRTQKCHTEYCSNGMPEKRWKRFTLEDGDEQ